MAVALLFQAVTRGGSGRRRVGTRRSSRGVPCQVLSQCWAPAPCAGQRWAQRPSGGQSAPHWGPRCHVSQRPLCPEFRSHWDIYWVPRPVLGALHIRFLCPMAPREEVAVNHPPFRQEAPRRQQLHQGHTASRRWGWAWNPGCRHLPSGPEASCTLLSPVPGTSWTCLLAPFPLSCLIQSIGNPTTPPSYIPRVGPPLLHPSQPRPSWTTDVTSQLVLFLPLFPPPPHFSAGPHFTE